MDRDRDGYECIATGEGRGNKKTVLEVEVIPLHYSEKMQNMMDSTLCRVPHQINVCEQALHLWKKGSSYGNVLSQVNYKRYGNMATRHSCYTNELEGISQLSRREKLFATEFG